MVVDNASSDDSATMVQPISRPSRCFKTTKTSASRGPTIGASAPRTGEWVCLLNSDTLVPPGALPRLVDWAERQPHLGGASPRLLRPDGSPQPYAFGDDPTLPYLLRRGSARILLGRALHDWATDRPRRVDWVSGRACCFAAKRSTRWAFWTKGCSCTLRTTTCACACGRPAGRCGTSRNGCRTPGRAEPEGQPAGQAGLSGQPALLLPQALRSG